MIIFKDLYKLIISPENLFLSWEKFKKGKRSKTDVAKFEFNLEKEIFKLHRELIDKTYKHENYHSFYICDPKVRHIHKATVRDRVLHHAIFRILNPIFEKTFIPNSFSCRIGKGNHKGVYVLEKMIRKVSKNYTTNCFALKCDIKKFFDSVDHEILLGLLSKKIRDQEVMLLLKEIIGSFSASQNLFEKKGLPIGNLTSQLFANVYMNEFDQFIKHELKIKYYARYTDDFVIISDSHKDFNKLLSQIKSFLKDQLFLTLHPHKVEVRKYGQGVDFLGYVIFPHHKLLRTKTKKRMVRKLKEKSGDVKEEKIEDSDLKQSLNSYLGLLSHANTHRFSENIKNKIWFWTRKQ
jgi:RNA-directed DNA polymerase